MSSEVAFCGDLVTVKYCQRVIVAVDVFRMFVKYKYILLYDIS